MKYRFYKNYIDDEIFTSSDSRNFPLRIGELLTLNHLKVSDLAKYMGVNQQTLYNWLQKDYKYFPKWFDYMYKLNKFFFEKLDYYDPMFLFCEINYDELVDAKEKDEKLRENLEHFYDSFVNYKDIVNNFKKLEIYEALFDRLKKNYQIDINNIEDVLENSITKPNNTNKKQNNDWLLKMLNDVELRKGLLTLKETYIDVDRKYKRTAKRDFIKTRDWVITHLIALLTDKTDYNINCTLKYNKLAESYVIADLPKQDIFKKQTD